jgi:hypothetical protein
MPVPLFKRYRQAPVKMPIKPHIIPKENIIETSLTPSIPSLNVLTTYNIGFTIDIDRQTSGRIFIE